MSNSTSVSVSTTSLRNSTTPAPTQQTQSFCITCGFNFGHIADGIDDSTMGMILVGCLVLVIVVIASLISCYCANKCCCAKKNKEYSGVPTSDSRNQDDRDNNAQDNNA